MFDQHTEKSWEQTTSPNYISVVISFKSSLSMICVPNLSTSDCVELASFFLGDNPNMMRLWSHEQLDVCLECISTFYARKVRKDQEAIDSWHALGNKIKELVEQQQQIDESLPEVSFVIVKNVLWSLRW